MKDKLNRLTQTQLSQSVLSLFSPQKLPSTILAFGILVRLVQYLANRSLWGDEAVLALNIVNRSFAGLLQPLDYEQGAPIGFLMVEKLAVQLLGDNEYALRLFPLLSGIVSLFLFWDLAKRCLQPAAVPIALALFASLHPLIYFSSEVKQYSSDVAIALLSCLLVMRASRQKLPARQAVALSAAGATAIWFSHPAIFVLAGAGGLSLLLCFREKDFARLGKLSAIYLTWAASFGTFYFLFVRQFNESASLFQSWKNKGGFPASFLDINWLFESLLEFFNNPLGFSEIVVGVALIAFLTGCAALYAGRKSTLLLLLSPLAVTLFAAYSHKYPFSRRLVLFLTPFAILLVAEGASYLRTKTRSSSAAIAGILLLVFLLAEPLASASYLFVQPSWKSEIKPVMGYVQEHRQSGDVLYIYQRGAYQFKYYAKKYGFQEGDYILGVDDLGQNLSAQEWERYKSDLDRLRGNKRVWVLFSHVWHFPEERKIIQLYLDSIGKRTDSFKRTGAFVYLYDLSQK